MHFDGVLFVAFGGPTPGCCKAFEPCPGSEAVCFVRAIVGDRPGAQARIAEVAAHYRPLGGFSPFNPLTFQQVEGVAARLVARGIRVPVRVGMRYWPPYVRDVLKEMLAQGCRSLLAVILSAFQSPASWDHYQYTVTQALAALRARAMRVAYLDTWHAQLGYVEALADRIRQASQELGPGRAREALLIYTAHALPEPMAATCPYVQQYGETAAAVAQRLGRSTYRLAYQSQVPGTPVPWLQPDVNAVIRQAKAEGYRDVIVAPIGFLCEHVEVLYDLDIEARQTAVACGIGYVRAKTVGDHPAFLSMLSERIAARLTEE